MSDSPHISASEAAQLLGVSLATLYSYVSRGLLRSSAPGPERRKRYPLDEVQRLAARRADGKRAGHVATDAMCWGLPVLETRIASIQDGQLRYRGQDPFILAEHATLEHTARLLWASEPDPFEAPAPRWPKPLHDSLRQATAGQPVLLRSLAALPALAQAIPAIEPQHGELADAALMRVLAALLLGCKPSAVPLHEQVAQAWGVAQDGALIRAALVLLADHELNASTFSVRCVASTGAPRWAAVCAGLAALAGPAHGGGSRAARQRIDAALAGTAPASAPWPAMGHPLYPQGDPRARHLLARLQAHRPHDERCAAVLALARAAESQSGLAPNTDWALAALGTVCGWPPDAGELLFALGRCAGWIAHAVEQAEAGSLIRPRARYIGPSLPPS